MSRLTYLLLLWIISFIGGFLITWLFYGEDKPIGIIILNSTEDEDCTYVEKNRFFIKPKIEKKMPKKKERE